MSLNTQNLGQRITTKDKVVVIWETDKSLWSKDGTIKTRSKFKVSVRVKDLSPITRVVLSLVMKTTFCEDGLKGETLESNVIWFVTLESILHVLLERGVEIFKTLHHCLLLLPMLRPF